MTTESSARTLEISAAYASLLYLRDSCLRYSSAQAHACPPRPSKNEAVRTARYDASTASTKNCPYAASSPQATCPPAQTMETACTRADVKLYAGLSHGFVPSGSRASTSSNVVYAVYRWCVPCECQRDLRWSWRRSASVPSLGVDAIFRPLEYTRSTSCSRVWRHST